MSNLLVDIEKVVPKGDHISYIKFNTHYCYNDDFKWIKDEHVYYWPSIWNFLDIDYDAGWGGADHPPFVAKTVNVESNTTTGLIICSCYDGATRIHWIPIDPVFDSLYSARFYGGGC